MEKQDELFSLFMEEVRKNLPRVVESNDGTFGIWRTFLKGKNDRTGTEMPMFISVDDGFITVYLSNKPTDPTVIFKDNVTFEYFLENNKGLIKRILPSFNITKPVWETENYSISFTRSKVDGEYLISGIVFKPLDSGKAYLLDDVVFFGENLPDEFVLGYLENHPESVIKFDEEDPEGVNREIIQDVFDTLGSIFGGQHPEPPYPVAGKRANK